MYSSVIYINIFRRTKGGGGSSEPPRMPSPPPTGVGRHRLHYGSTLNLQMFEVWQVDKRSWLYISEVILM